MRQEVIAVIGADTLGRSLALRCARAGFRTVLEDVLPSNLRSAAAWIEESGADGIEYANSVEDAVRRATLALDCVPDELESKLEIFSLLDRMAPPDCMLVTPTRTLSIADLASCTYRGDRCFSLEMPDTLLRGEAPGGERVTLRHTTAVDPTALARAVAWLTAISLSVSVAVDALEVH